MNKYSAKRTWSELCQRTFASKAECVRGEELTLLERAGEISDLQYHQKYLLSKSPKVAIEVDFVYNENGITIYEDVKGKETREYRVKRIWLNQKYQINIRLMR